MLMDYMQRGGPVMYPLLACSVVGLTVIVERLLFWMKLRLQPKQWAACLRCVQEGSDQRALELADARPDPVFRVLMKGLKDPDPSPRIAMEQQGREEVKQMTQYLVGLDTVITLAPLLGIYGTITGIIRAFGFLGATGVPEPQLVAAGIAEALITTAAGLTIAISAVPFYNHFVRRAEHVTHDMEQHATTLELLLERRRRAQAADSALEKELA